MSRADDSFSSAGNAAQADVAKPTPHFVISQDTFLIEKPIPIVTSAQ
jgi:hypothetical protein